MIIVNLKGGLGNQMFQYALGRKLALKTGQELKLDLTGFDRDHSRAFGLDNFNIIKPPATPAEIKRVKYPYGWFSKGWRWFRFKILRVHHTGWEPKTLNQIERKLKTHDDFYLDGFWQSHKYIEDVRENLLTDFTPKESLEKKYPDLIAQIKNTNSVGIHLRRGDYATNSRVLREFGVCSIAYYQRAIKLLAEKIDQPNLFIISDDINWVKENLPTDHPTVYVSELGTKDYEELLIMSQGKHNIIANSTFSWWGAWLNNNPDKIVIAPEPWFNNNSIKIDDIIPPTWIRLPRN
ncbi:MAG: alpha-1,2-fucosyltransferase [Candidatus Vogelbacteria bacterium CG10_big_fil_rev_8_21_14_0_10_49_38]|uniref:Alpha-1,2-fucosyltransferase n=1 Tax=Candidatus Vogelbacteria bacterium CG10_big_fil_rev_8_21_14_0_10_49_38 TaxID=1975043 RepID=A0A2H0RI80_9BACT|nr:MAG: hypothetical protein BK006_01735 [bacterium CG10_49_38]PIR46116.1 MAG: alpha-1,2-fucosyltransferase [Candidatus Vogelbacteria bacterium CG10_big_fil_rev_8_21_14_0_10_49_38]